MGRKGILMTFKAKTYLQKENLYQYQSGFTGLLNERYGRASPG